MPTNPERRTQILDTAIDILCDDGVGGLTHRQVDSRADLPAGTTSNYFRTRQALLEANRGQDGRSALAAGGGTPVGDRATEP